ncbi:MAG: acyl-ACP--UDP-N-acetylglucosamine O-acyltransferase [Verrucomicrobiia bacterium]
MNALIHPSAKIGSGCSFGPGAIVGEHVEIGDRCEIRAHAILTGHTTIGPGTQIGYGAVIGAEPQDHSFDPATISHVRIGAGNVIREYATIHRGTRPGSATIIGDSNFIMAGAHIAHNCSIGNHVTLVNNTLLAGYVEVHDRAFLGGAVVVHQFVRIGQLVMIRGQTRIGLDVPPFFMAVDTNTVAGLNRVGLRRHGLSSSQIRTLHRIYQRLYFHGLNRHQAIAAIRADPELASPEGLAICDFLEKTKRGISRPARGATRNSDPEPSV